MVFISSTVTGLMCLTTAVRH